MPSGSLDRFGRHRRALRRFQPPVTCTAEAPGLYNFARYLTRDAPLAEELVQDAFARTLGARAHFVAGSDLKAWLFRMLRNAFLDTKRRERRNPVTLRGASEDENEASDAATFVFKHRLHTATLFVFRGEGLDWPLRHDTRLGGLPANRAASRGSNVLLWRQRDLGCALVSDMAAADLALLGERLAANEP